MRPLIAFITVLLFQTVALADVVIDATSIKGDGQAVVTRFANLPQYATTRKIVAAGETFTLPAVGDWDAIEVSGILKLPRDYDCQIRIVHLTVLPGGSLDFGRPNDPCLKNYDIVIKNVTLLKGTDAEPGPDADQFGNGILIWGEWVAQGIDRQRWTTMQPVIAGATTITVTDARLWAVGDELRIPDTRQPRYEESAPHALIPIRRESPVTIAAISGNTVTLSKPLDFEHLDFLDDQGLLGHPYVVNATSNIVIRSENPAGTRGHTMWMDSAHVDVRSVAFIGLGRTTGDKIDNTTHPPVGQAAPWHIGENQIARYMAHWHHVHGHADAQGLTGRLLACFFDGMDGVDGAKGNKWAVVQHGTHDVIIADNAVDRCTGAGISAEDGFEIRGQWLRNLVMGCSGNPNGLDAKQLVVIPASFSPGSEGAGFWFHGSHHVIKDNVSINNVIGFQFLHMGQVLNRQVPSAPGGEPDTDYDPRDSTPIEFKGNVAAANAQTGLEFWITPIDWTASDFKSWHNGRAGATSGGGEPGNITLVNPSFFNQDGIGHGVHSSGGYTSNVSIDGGQIVGFAHGVVDVSQFSLYTLKNIRMKNKANADWEGVGRVIHQGLIENVAFEKLTPDTRHVVMGDGTMDANAYGERWYGHGPRVTVKNWQGTGKNYNFFENYQKRDNPINFASGLTGCPEAGLNMGQCWDKYGLGPYGSVAPAGSVPLDGLANGVAAEQPFVLGPPRTVVLSPLATVPAVAGDFGMLLQTKLTGLDDGSEARLQVDDLPPTSPAYTQGVGIDDKYFYSPAITPGTHSVKTWREKDGVKTAGSDLSTTYTVGPVVVPPVDPPPPPPPPPVVETLTGVVGSGVITLKDKNGAPVTHLPVGSYAVEVDDQSAHHNFHLFGPGFDRMTTIAEIRKDAWLIVLTTGTYVFVCDAHVDFMRGSFTVGVSPPVNHPPIVAPIMANPPDVDPVMTGVQEYVSTSVTYSAIGSDPDGDALNRMWFYSINGAPRVQYTTNAIASINYGPNPLTYVWTVEDTDSKGAMTSQTLTVQVIATPDHPPTADTLAKLRADFEALKAYLKALPISAP